MNEKKLRKSQLLSLPMLFSALVLVGCGDNMSDLHAYMSEVKARPAAPIEPIPAIKPYVRFIYPGHDADPGAPREVSGGGG